MKADREVARRTASGPGIPSKEGETPAIRELRLKRQYLGYPFITEGSVFTFPLVDFIQGPSIEANNYRIVGLAVYGKNGVLYGTTSGDESHLFFMDKKKLIVDIGKVENRQINNNSLSIATNSYLYFSATDERNNSILLKHDVDTDYTDQYPLDYFGSIEETGELLSNDSLVDSLFCDWDQNIYYLSKSGKILRFVVSKEKLEVLTELGTGFSETICCDQTGHLFGAAREGELFRFDLLSGRMEKLAARAPTQKGREYLAGVRKMVCKGHVIYGCTSQDSYLFKFDTDRDALFNYGRPDENYDLRSIVVEQDGRVFGTTSMKGKGVGHLFVYGENGFRDLGNIVGFRPANGWCNEPQIMVLGNDGEIFIADGDNRSKLFLYFPNLPISRCQAETVQQS